MMSTLRESPSNGSKQLYTNSGYSSFPFELLNTIFHQCNRDDLKQCALTCRSWNAAARPILFSKIVLNSTTTINDFISPFIENNAIGELVKEVDFRWMLADLHSLNLLSKAFKNIEAITFNKTPYDIYRDLYDLLSAGGFSSLKSLPKPANRDQTEMYLKCVDIMKHRMTKIDIVGAKAYESLQQSFHVFIKLQAINIRFNDSLPMNVVNLLEDIAQKSNLPSLKRIDIAMVINSSADDELFPTMDDIKPMLNVSDLKVSGYIPQTIIDDTFMCYIIKKFPNLQRLELLSYENDYDGSYWYFPKVGNQIELSVDVTVKFLEYISRLSTSNVQHIATEEKTAEVIESFYSHIKKKSSDVPLSLYIYYNEEKEEDEEIDLVFPIVSMNSAQALQRHAPSVSVGLNPFYDPILNNGQEEQKLMKHTGQYLTKISLDDVPDFSFFRILLTSIAEHCTNLKEFVILNASELLEETIEWNNLVSNHSLTHLTVDSDEECPNLLSFLSYLFVGLEMLSLISTRTHIRLPRKRFDLIAPRLSVKHFLFGLPAYGDYRLKTCSNFKVFVQLDVGEKSRFLVFPMLLHTELKTVYDHNPLRFDKEITASEFEESKKNDENYYVYYVQCKSTEKVSIQYAAEQRIESADGDNLVYEIHEVHF